jgi:protein gp37
MEIGPSAWWDVSWNPSAGCRPILGVCDNCYAAQQAGTLHQSAGANREVRALYDGIVELGDDVRWRFNGRTTVLEDGHPTWSFPLVYPGAERPVLGPGKPSLVFVADMSDQFFRQPRRVIDKVVDTIATSPHIGLICTRRVRRMSAYFCAPASLTTLQCWQEHFWLGTSTAHQQEFDAAWPQMRPLADQGYTIFFSIAPMMGAVVLPPDLLARGGRVWVIVAGEQGKHDRCRDMEADWARRIRDQCANAGVAFFFKQQSRKAPIPIDLMIREFPRVERPPC